jgi:cyanophycinase
MASKKNRHPQRKLPRGKLLIIGGAEDKGKKEHPAIADKLDNFRHFEILKSIIPEKKRGGMVEIVTTASERPKEQDKRYKEAFSEVGYKNIGFIHITNSKEAANPSFVQRVRKSHAVLFTGGNQLLLTTVFGNTPIHEAIIEKYMKDPEFIIAGTSAGAMAVAGLMIYEGESGDGLLKGAVKITSGLGFVHGCIIDTHFIKRGRFGRLIQAIALNPPCVGIGIEEDTALLITKGNEAHCIGSGMVIIIDGRDMQSSNIASAEDYEPLCMENLRVHVLNEGKGFLLDSRITTTATSRKMKKRKKQPKNNSGPKR